MKIWKQYCICYGIDTNIPSNCCLVNVNIDKGWAIKDNLCLAIYSTIIASTPIIKGDGEDPDGTIPKQLQFFQSTTILALSTMPCPPLPTSTAISRPVPCPCSAPLWCSDTRCYSIRRRVRMRSAWWCRTDWRCTPEWGQPKSMEHLHDSGKMAGSWGMVNTEKKTRCNHIWENVHWVVLYCRRTRSLSSSSHRMLSSWPGRPHKESQHGRPLSGWWGWVSDIKHRIISSFVIR